MYYIEKDNKILFADDSRQTLVNTIAFQSDLTEDDIKEVPEGYVIKDFKLMTIEEVKKEEEKAERERLDMLNLTGADVERAIYKVKGIDFDDILAMVKDIPTIDEKALKIEFKANNFYRGNPYINQVGALLGFTSKQLDKFFETKDYTYLKSCTLKINTTPENAIVTGAGTYPYGTEVDWKVEAEGYVSQKGNMPLTEDVTLDIELEKEEVEEIEDIEEVEE